MRLVGAAPSPPLLQRPTPYLMALKASGEDPKPLFYDLGGTILRGERIGGGFSPR
jgi:hypothetical protein